MIRLISIIKEILAEQTPSEQAKAMGLKHIGYGRWWDPRLKKITHMTRRGKLLPYTPEKSDISNTDASYTNDSGETKRTKSRGEVDALVATQEEDWNHPQELWNDPNNTLYGKPPEGAPNITQDILDGKYRTAPIEGIVGDIGINTVEHLVPSFEDREDLYYNEEVEDSLWNKFKEDGPETLAGNFDNLMSWMNGHAEGKGQFIETAQQLFPTRMDTQGPLVRGLYVGAIALDKFMSDFEIGSSISFSESYSFTTDGLVAEEFAEMGVGGSSQLSKDPDASAKDTFQSNYPVIIRMHPAEDGLTSGIYVPGVVEAYASTAASIYQEKQSDDHPNRKLADRMQKGITDADSFLNEREFLTLPNTQYEVIGRTRMESKRGDNTIVIDIREKSPQTSEQGLPGRPTLPKLKATPVNKVVHHYMDKPLNPNK